MLPCQEPFQVLEQMVVAGSKIKINCCSGSAQKSLSIPLIVPILLLVTTICSRTSKGSWPGKHFSSDDELQTDGCQRLPSISGCGFLRYKCRKIRLTV
ncbi:hypothetical protein AVEN_17678-1 [Araneus ventricosus]|uniref:Uncharacterized protein n=1 Tax=Araneus ventricosus TaxID=182803 RepID=A0A4Y2VV50_ARAVE|nr:hypothetical protein AVEN_17678-1 [Araneus ventricosus]